MRRSSVERPTLQVALPLNVVASIISNKPGAGIINSAVHQQELPFELLAVTPAAADLSDFLNDVLRQRFFETTPALQV